MMLFMLAKNCDRVVFSELINYIHAPEYHWDVEPLDKENLELI